MDRPNLTRAPWRKASRSAAQGTCVEVSRRPHGVAVRDSKDPEGPRLHFDRAAWSAFTEQIRNGMH